MSYLVEDERTSAALRAWCGHDSTLLTPSFFFWSSDSNLQKSMQGLLRSLVYQLLEGSKALLDDFLNLLPRAGAPSICDDKAWTERRLLSILDKILELLISRGIYICCFLDGLDEYDVERDLLNEWIFKLSA